MLMNIEPWTGIRQGTLLRARLIVLLGVMVPNLVLGYGNGFSFDNAGNGMVAYSDSPYRPTITCDALATTEFPDARILSTESVPATADAAPHCLVYGHIEPEIEFVIHLPGSWSGRLYVHGNGGDGGESVRGDYGTAIRRAAVNNGFVATFNNMGHDGSAYEGSRWAFNSSRREIDYRYRALHLNTLIAKLLIEKYYDQPPDYSYFDGCSTGGGQALRAARDFPDDFDGILAGAPVFDPITLLLYVWNNQMAQEIMQLTPARLTYLGSWLMNQYDSVDGVEDGVISNPGGIDFDPERDLPRDGAGRDGFTESEIEGLARVYGGLVYDGRQVAPGVPIGAELPGQKYRPGSVLPDRPASAWEGRILPGSNGSIGMRAVLQEWMRYILFEDDDPSREWDKLDLQVALPKLARRAEVLSAAAPELDRFRKRGGKLLIYNGWADVGVNPYLVLSYYQELQSGMGADTAAFARLFLVPGMFHCAGGLNVDRFDAFTPLVDWVEGGQAPDRIAAHRIEDQRVTRTRPLCAYPAIAGYTGDGSIDDSRNFVCR